MSLTLPFAQLHHLASQHGESIFMSQPHRGQWQHYSYFQVAKMTTHIAQALANLGLQPGERVAIAAKNSMAWMIADWAICQAGLISVPIFAAADGETIRYILQHSDAKAVFIGQLDGSSPNLQDFEHCHHRIALPNASLEAELNWHDLLMTDYPPLPAIDINPTDTMTIIYTSGSTGQPKGVELSYQSYIMGCHGYIDDIEGAVGLGEERYLSYLPLAHITERVLGQGVCLYSSRVNCFIHVYFVESLDTFTDNLQHCQPTIFVSVPRLWQKFQEGILARLPQQKLTKYLSIPLLGKVFSYYLRTKLGLQKCKIFASGSAPIPPSLLDWFAAIGIPISQGWGMTETNACGTMQLPYRHDKRNSIGKPLSSVQIKIDPTTQEILIKGACLLTRYYRQPELSEEAFDSQGFFHTGDQGKMDEEGYIQIIGRLKDLFKTTKGKYIAPAPIEAALAKSPLLDQVCVVGEGLSQPVVLAELSESGLQQDNAPQLLEALIHEINPTLAKHEKLAGMWLVKDRWTVENGLITPTLKIRRAAIEAHYQALYQQTLPAIISYQP